jgi:hypothetical protein
LTTPASASPDAAQLDGATSVSVRTSLNPSAAPLNPSAPDDLFIHSAAEVFHGALDFGHPCASTSSRTSCGPAHQAPELPIAKHAHLTVFLFVPFGFASAVAHRLRAYSHAMRGLTGKPCRTHSSSGPSPRCSADTWPWVEANLKETDLTHVVPGQPATVVLVMYPDEVWNGMVESISPVTGAEFAILPPQNASGN